MGLDNSIEVKRNEYTNSIPELQRFNVSWDKEHKYDFEITYWRKCWNIREMIFDAIEGGCNNGISDPSKIIQLKELARRWRLNLGLG